MSKQFQFRDHRTELDIAGNKFYVDTTNPELLKRIERFGREAQAQDFVDPEDSHIVQVERSMEFMQGAIDDMLGEGATEQIFEGREPSFFDMLDVAEYIRDMTLNNQQKQFERYSPERVKREK